MAHEFARACFRSPKAPRCLDDALTRVLSRRDLPFLIVVVVALALAARLLWVASVDPVVGLEDDAGYYHYYGERIADGDGYIRPDGRPTAFWPIGYPGTLAALYTVAGPSLTAAKLLNVALGAGITALLYVLARRWFSRPQSALAAGLYALWPGAIFYASVTMSETLFTFLFMASLVVLAYEGGTGIRAFWHSGISESESGMPECSNARMLESPFSLRRCLVFSFFVAASNYVRVQTLALSLLALPWLLLQGWPLRRALAYSAVSLFAVALLMVPWVVRNTLTFDRLTFLATNSGTNFYQGHRDGADGGPDFQAQVAFAQRFDHLPPKEQEPAWNSEGFREGLEWVMAHPEQEPRLALQKVYQLFRRDADGLLWNEQNGATPIFTTAQRDNLRLLADGYYYVAGLLALAGLAYGLWRRESWALFCGLILLYWIAVHVAFYGEPRLHVPIQPLIALLASVVPPLLLKREILAFEHSGIRA